MNGSSHILVIRITKRTFFMAVTMMDIAKVTKVSQPTVSLVLNGKAGVRVSKAKSDLIKETAKKLGYRANIAARALKTKRQYSIGIIMPMASSFYNNMVVEIQHSLISAGYTGIFAFWDSYDDVDQAMNTVLDRDVDGIITWELTEPILHSGKPLSYYGNSAMDNIDCAFWEDRKSVV